MHEGQVAAGREGLKPPDVGMHDVEAAADLRCRLATAAMRSLGV
jgi:hypothetical protein